MFVPLVTIRTVFSIVAVGLLTHGTDFRWRDDLFSLVVVGFPTHGTDLRWRDDLFSLVAVGFPTHGTDLRWRDDLFSLFVVGFPTHGTDLRWRDNLFSLVAVGLPIHGTDLRWRADIRIPCPCWFVNCLVVVSAACLLGRCFIANRAAEKGFSAGFLDRWFFNGTVVME